MVIIKRLLFIILILIIYTSLAAEETKEGKVCFNWAFVYKDETGFLQSIDFNKQINNLKPGNRLKIYLEPVQNAYIYVIHYDSNKELFLLFPDRKKELFYDYQSGRGYYIPEKKIWFYLKNDSGMEFFYLIVSPTRCKDLEKALHEYFRFSDTSVVQDNESDTAKQVVLEEIRNLKKRNSVFQGLVEKPLIVAGDYRGDDTIHQFIYTIEVENFYAKTIRVAH
ncbi:MAG: DUF4384 domain-containing protein [Spirochaetales bacterium]|nr:DUF4384 domain-containing protein [Spirochaetales bacterium]